MAAAPSTMFPLGTAASPFALPDVGSGTTISLETFAGKKAVLVMFLLRHCRVCAACETDPDLLRMGVLRPDLGIVASANDATAYAEDAPDSLKVMAAAESFTFPLCYDESQAVPKAYTAACTPDFPQAVAAACPALCELRPDNCITRAQSGVPANVYEQQASFQVMLDTWMCWLCSTSFLNKDDVHARCSPMRSVFSRLLTRLSQLAGSMRDSITRVFPSFSHVQSVLCPGVTGFHLLSSYGSVRRCSLVLDAQRVPSVPAIESGSTHDWRPSHDQSSR